jgi:hypothetical protein
MSGKIAGTTVLGLLAYEKVPLPMSNSDYARSRT